VVRLVGSAVHLESVANKLLTESCSGDISKKSGLQLRAL
jgi:hypothetical protein